MMQAQDSSMVKPLLRGHFHQAGFFIALGACAMLVVKSAHSSAIWPVLIYSLSLVGLLGMSALYHRPQWRPSVRTWLKRLDHAAIFVLIAGTGTPIFVIALPDDLRNKLLLLTWGATILGVLQSVFWVKAPKWVSAVLCLFVGWIILPYLPEIKAAMALKMMGLSWLYLGGLVYSIGAVVYALKWPNPSPRYFGYHEIFHLLVNIAATFHFIVIYGLVG